MLDIRKGPFVLVSTQRSWKGIVFIAVSLDGYIARKNGDMRWLTDLDPDVGHGVPHDPGIAGDYAGMYKNIDAIVLGRGSYETVVKLKRWPYPGKRVIVLSHNDDIADDRVSVALSVDQAIELCEQQGAKAVYIDGGRTIQAFLERDMIDEIHLTRAPVLIGSGLPLFGRLSKDIKLKLRHVGTSAQGYVHTLYDVVR